MTTIRGFSWIRTSLDSNFKSRKTGNFPSGRERLSRQNFMIAGGHSSTRETKLPKASRRYEFTSRKRKLAEGSKAWRGMAAGMSNSPNSSELAAHSYDWLRFSSARSTASQNATRHHASGTHRATLVPLVTIRLDSAVKETDRWGSGRGPRAKNGSGHYW
jgi:hypothetical protein